MSKNREAELLEAMKYASLPEQRKLTAELDQLRAEAQLQAEADRDTDLANAIIEDHLTPVLVHGMHSTATDWLGEDVASYTTADLKDIGSTMRAEASVWFSTVSPGVRANRDELREQARGVARRLGSQYGEVASHATNIFMEYVGRLVTAEGTDMGNIPSAAGDNTKPQSTAWSEQETLPEADAQTLDAPPGIDAAPEAPSPYTDGKAGEPSSRPATTEHHLPKEDTHDDPKNAGDTRDAITYESAQQRAIRRYFATEEGQPFPVPGERDPEQDGEAASSLPIGVDVSGHPDFFPNFMENEPAKDAPSSRAPQVQGRRRSQARRTHQAIATGPNPQGSFIYDPIKVESKGYEEGFAYALVWQPGKPIPAALTSSAGIGNKYNAEYVVGYKAGVADGIAALSSEFQAAFASAHKARVLANRKRAADSDSPDATFDDISGETGADDSDTDTQTKETENTGTDRGEGNLPGTERDEGPGAAKGARRVRADGPPEWLKDKYDEWNGEDDEEKEDSSKESRRRRQASPNTLEFDDINQTVAFPFTWSTDGTRGQGAADVGSVPTPGAANGYPQPSRDNQEQAVGDEATELEPIEEENADPAKVEAVRRYVQRSRLGFSGSRRQAAGYGDTSPFQDDWADQYAQLKAQTDTCPHCKSAKTRTGDPDAICGPHRDNMRVQYSAHPASESYWTSSKTAWQNPEGSVPIVGDPVSDHECVFCGKPGYTVSVKGDVVCEDHRRDGMRDARKTGANSLSDIDTSAPATDVYDEALEYFTDVEGLSGEDAYEAADNWTSTHLTARRSRLDFSSAADDGSAPEDNDSEQPDDYPSDSSNSDYDAPPKDEHSWDSETGPSRKSAAPKSAPKPKNWHTRDEYDRPEDYEDDDSVYDYDTGKASSRRRSHRRTAILTADGVEVGDGDRVFNYYDGAWGTITNIDPPNSYTNGDPWFTLKQDDGSRATLNGERVCVIIPRGNPFYKEFGGGQ